MTFMPMISVRKRLTASVYTCENIHGKFQQATDDSLMTSTVINMAVGTQAAASSHNQALPLGKNCVSIITACAEY